MGMMNSLFVQRQILNDGKTQGRVKHFIKIYICKYVVKIGFGGTQPPLLALGFCVCLGLLQLWQQDLKLLACTNKMMFH